MPSISPLGQSNRYLQPGSQSEFIHREALRFMPRGNTRASVFTHPYPPYVASGRGCRLIDVEGVERIDFHNNYTALILGHANPKVNQAITAQLQLGACFAMPTQAEIELAEIICDRVPSIEHIRFANSGTEAVLFAIRAARAYTGKTDIAKFEGAFHGAYDYVDISLAPTLAKAGSREAPTSVAQNGGILDSVLEHVLVLPWNNADASAELIRKNKDRLAAVIVDPMPNYSGLIPPVPGFLETLRAITEECEVLLVCDEILNFRLGYAGAQGRFGINPDLTVLGKIIGGGLPVGAIGGNSAIMSVFDPMTGTVVHSGTATANPLTMVAGIATLQQLDSAEYDRLDALGSRLRSGAETIMEEIGFPGQVTGLGSLFRIHLTDAVLSDYRSTLLNEKQKAMKESLYYDLLAKGVFIATSGMGCLSTPMAEQESDFFVQALRDSLVDLKKQFL